MGWESSGMVGFDLGFDLDLDLTSLIIGSRGLGW